MIIVKLWGGMGNQMFQYAFGRCLAHRYNTTLKLDLSFFSNQPKNKKHVFRNYDLDIFNIQENFATKEEVYRLARRFSNDLLEKAFNKLFGTKKSFIGEPHFHFSEEVYNAPDNVYLSGYWQTEKYFSAIAPIIREEFTYKAPIGEMAAGLLKEIENANSICLNVRRGDFVTNSFHGSYGSYYFEKADKIVQEKFNEYKYFIFSDEIEWCIQNLKFDVPVIYVDHEYAGYKYQDYLRLMTACKHFVIPNSSFAWWAVWLNGSRDNLVIAPQKWFGDPSYNTSDLGFQEWIRI